MKKGRIRDVSQALVCSEFYVKGGKEVFAYGVKAINEYSEECVRLRLCDMVLCIMGSTLTLKSYYNGSVRVCGQIRGVEFER